MVGETAVGEFDSGNFFGESFSDGYAWIDAYTATQSVRFLAWMADGVEWQEPIRRRAALPAPLYWSVVKPLSFIARVPGPSIWAGTPAARIKSRMTLA